MTLSFFKMSDNVLCDGSPINAKEYLVLSAIAAKANRQSARYVQYRGESIWLETDHACVSQSDIERATTKLLTRNQIRTALERLKRLQIIHQTNHQGRITGLSVYFIDLDKIQNPASPSAAPSKSPSNHQATTKQPPTDLETKSLRIDSESPTNSESKTRDSESLDETCPASPDKSSGGFSEWWSCWRLKGAKRGDKQRSERLYKSIIRRGARSHDQLCDDVERLQQHYERNGTQVSKMLHPATFLSQERWNDELVLDADQIIGANGHGKPNSSSGRGSGAIADLLDLPGDDEGRSEGDGSGALAVNGPLEGTGGEPKANLCALGEASDGPPDWPDDQGYWDFNERAGMVAGNGKL